MASFTLIISTSDDFFSILSIEYKYYGATVIIPSKNFESGLPWGRYEQKLRLKKPPDSEKHLIFTVLSSISPHLKVRRLWVLF